MTSLSTIISEASNQVINVRDFAGSKSREKDVAVETLNEYDIEVTPEILAQVFAEANGEWRQSQKDAGVNSKYFT